jgi:hypothetical protein
MDDLEEFHRQFLSEVQGGADADGLIVIEMFFEKVSELLQEAGETDGSTRAYYVGNDGKNSLQVDGYGGDPRDADNVLSLVICDFSNSTELRIRNAKDVTPIFKRLTNFLRAARKAEYRDALEETSAGFGLADLIATTWNKIEKIKLILITNTDCRAKVDAFPAGTIDEKPVTYNIWDIKRIRKFVEQGQSREDLVVNFEADFDGAIPILRASGSDAALESYLAVIPGRQLAAIYDKWGARLLEANVRAFLQAKGGVNKGIRKTIVEEPHMFLAYNNGIAATAEAAEIRETPRGLELISAENLQIVNGGQTTASIHAARKQTGVKLDEIFVQMKLNVVPKHVFETVVPKISEYANSQNKVSAADFFANHPFHIRTQEFSRRILAPAGENGYRETKWFYERARGQYADERARLTEGQRKTFDNEYPKAQFFTKTDLAKYENTFLCKPHIVSLGAQKNFTEFARTIGVRWGDDGAGFQEDWFRKVVARAIIFRTVEKLVSSAAWYESGYRANIVTYAIAKVVHDANERERVIDLDRIWRLQSVPTELCDALLIAGAEAQWCILNPVGSVRNLGEWAKKQACWQSLASRELTYPDEIERVLIDNSEQRRRDREATNDRETDNGIENQTRVFELGAAFWLEVLNFGRSKRALSEKEAGVLKTCGEMPSTLPTERQCDIAVKALVKVQNLGFAHPLLEPAN